METNTDKAESIRDRYRALFGKVPQGIDARITLGEISGRVESIVAIENLRDELIMKNPLGLTQGQLVHFGQLIVLGRSGPASSHATAAYKAGASIAELVGVAELALITGGMPAYALGVEIISKLVEDEAKSTEG